MVKGMGMVVQMVELKCWVRLLKILEIAENAEHIFLNCRTILYHMQHIKIICLKKGNTLKIPKYEGSSLSAS